MSAAAVRAIGLSKTFGRGKGAVRALNGIDLEIPFGQVTGLIGPNGAGKSTFIKLLLGYLTPTSGDVHLLNHEPGDTRALRQIGYLPENPAFPPYLTGKEILRYFATLLGMPKSERLRRADEVLTQVGIAHAADRRVESYSKGMAQRLGLAQALLASPKMLILDEPMSGLDPVGRAEMKRLLLERKQQGTSVLFCSHILDDVERLCDWVVMLAHGRVQLSSAMNDVLFRAGTQWAALIRAPQAPDVAGVDWQSASHSIWHAEGLTEAQFKAVMNLVAHADHDVELIRGGRDGEDLEEMFINLVQGT